MPVALADAVATTGIVLGLPFAGLIQSTRELIHRSQHLLETNARPTLPSLSRQHPSHRTKTSVFLLVVSFTN